MTTTIITGVSVGPGTLIAAMSQDSLFVSQSGVLGSTYGTAVTASGNGFYASIAGAVYGEDVGMLLGNGDSSYSMMLHILDGGVVAGRYAVKVAAGRSDIVNSGTIDGNYLGIYSESNGGLATIQNFGTIKGGTALYANGTTVIELFNAGTMAGTGVAAVLGSGFDKVVNSGIMNGDIYLYGGDDLYQATRAGSVEGTIRGGEGNDTFIIGTALETITGDAGFDRVINNSVLGARMSLTDDAGTGVAAGDTYVGVEQLFGSNVGADQLIGDGAANWLFGRGGNDVLLGQAGNDVLTGGLGVDTMAGGLDNDVFVYTSAAFGGDKIQDFGVGNDAIRVSASGFGGGLATGVLGAPAFWASTTGLAHDTDDRFILKTTDRTLWFDRDGTGAAARVLIADLNDGATFTAGDIFVFA